MKPRRPRAFLLRDSDGFFDLIDERLAVEHKVGRHKSKAALVREVLFASLRAWPRRSQPPSDPEDV